MDIYPREFTYPIEGASSLELLLTVGKNSKTELFWVESLIIFAESKKIFRSLGVKYGLGDEEAAVSEGLRAFRAFRLSIL